MKVGLAALVLFLVATLFTSASARNWRDEGGAKVDWNCAFVGNDYKCLRLGTKGSDPQRCRRLCLVEARCTHFTDNNVNMCCLKNAKFMIETTTPSPMYCGFIPGRSQN